MPLPIQIVLVPQGAEYQAVCRGLRKVSDPPIVLPVPVGPIPIGNHLKTLQENGNFSNQPNILMMGLCGSLTSPHSIASLVLYQGCINDPSTPHPTPHTPHPLPTNRPLTTHIQQKLGKQVTLVRALTSDRVIWSAAEKRSLATAADVVDMEGYPTLEFLSQIGIAVAMLRVVSDDSQHDLPDLTWAFSSEGALLPGRMAIGMLRQPIGAVRLIQGSLRGLNVLQRVTTTLFS
ncbi:phosphorylase [Kovacikia minuta CCNUW1]|uniref:phosphorylase family protein n=1 Tax=Kovacikia minuta TaxID=2931930 RepID=UPI001CCDA695|nr:phosphorylase [Kovacikia minuta]UBF26090.1 phosphorylase [Kovacikia minuta CCNUW1]